MSDTLEHVKPLREGPAIRLKMAKEFAGFDGSDKEFRKTAAAAGVDPNVPGDEGQRRYLPSEIRRIAQYVTSSFAEVKPELYIPALMVFRITKGGTGKTTTCANAAVALVMRGFRVLLIDADSQGSLSMTMGYDINAGIRLEEDSAKGQIGNEGPDNIVHIGHLLKRIAEGKPARASEAVVPVYKDGMLDLLPADITLANEGWMFNSTGREWLFTKLLEDEREFFSRYDAILVDCAPGMSLLATSIMTAANAVTAVVTPEPQSLVALAGIENNLAEINTMVRRGLPPVGLHVIMNDFRGALEPHKKAERYLGRHYGPYMNTGSVRSFVGFKREIDVDDISNSQPLLEKDQNCPGAADVFEVVKHLIKLYGVTMFADAQNVASGEMLEEVA